MVYYGKQGGINSIWAYYFRFKQAFNIRPKREDFTSYTWLLEHLTFFFFFFLITLFTLVVTIRPQVAFHCTPANSCFSLQFISTSAKSQHNFNYIHTIYIIDYIK